VDHCYDCIIIVMIVRFYIVTTPTLYVVLSAGAIFARNGLGMIYSFITTITVGIMLDIYLYIRWGNINQHTQLGRPSSKERNALSREIMKTSLEHAFPLQYTAKKVWETGSSLYL